MRNVKRLIYRLIERLEGRGFSSEDIKECIRYITE